MFIKPFKVKSNILVTGSERKRLKLRAQTQFGIRDSSFDELFGNKSKVCVVKIITFSEAQVTVYTSDKRPMFFELDGKLIPTVYTLWACMEMVPYFTTHPMVLPKLANGADLMIPGVVRHGNDLKSWGNYRKDDIVAVNLTSNKAAVGVGLLAHASDDLYMCGGRGICVRMLHVFGDKLWGMEPSVCQQVPLLGGTQSIPKDTDFPPLGEPEQVKEINEPVSFEQLDDVGVDNKGNEIAADNSEQATEDDNQLDPDKLIKSAFLNSIKLHGKKIQLPMLTSTFYPQYVQPELPEGIEMKRSSYKKVGTFLKKMAEEGLLQIKEEKKGIEKIVSISLDHPEVLSFYPYKKKSEGVESTDAGGDQNSSTPLLLTKMIEMYAVNEATEKFFGSMGIPVGRTLDMQQVRNKVKDYAGRNKLVDPQTKLVSLDETLLQMCGAEPKQMNLASLTDAVLRSMTNTFEMRSQTGPVSKGGKRAIIHLTTATRSGNKKVTLISNLEDYGVNVAEFAKAVKLGAAASTTMTEVPGTKGEQLLVQGNHIKFVYELLTGTYQVPKSCITGLEFAKERGKKKK
ncbi:eukaryotic translation initiation factor 2D [Toxorhynchites rutilus septentrionalis]|uniref:eukaryotic translation initiation factor 2D n=1 Tax=Toxorhynchites rutilus septentrionalis TaxID=329112 RepID=UPI00247A0206|nr:eukaryotic translation initiation factor 2D [Toxorhynchites rutilus septentrionalis]